MVKVKVQKGSWKPKATYNAATKLVELVKKPERRPAFAERDVTDEELATLKSKAEALETATRNKDQLLEGQVSATTALGKECAKAARYVINVREALKRHKVSEAARTAAGIGKTVDPKRSDKVVSAIDSIIGASGDEDVGPELGRAGFRPGDITRLQEFKTNIQNLDKKQEQKKGERKEKGVDLRKLHRDVQDGANRLLGLAHLIYAEDDDTLKLFTDCLPRSAGGTGAEIEEDEEPETEEEKPEVPVPA